MPTTRDIILLQNTKTHIQNFAVCSHQKPVRCTDMPIFTYTTVRHTTEAFILQHLQHRTHTFYSTITYFVVNRNANTFSYLMCISIRPASEDRHRNSRKLYCALTMRHNKQLVFSLNICSIRNTDDFKAHAFGFVDLMLSQRTRSKSSKKKKHASSVVM